MDSSYGNPLRTLWIKLLRFSRAPGKGKFCIGLLVAVYFIVSWQVWKYHSESSYKHKLSVLKKRLLHYCNPVGPPLGNEHNEPMEYAQFKLKQVQVVGRHGDRSSVVNDFPGLMHFNCELSSRNFQHAKKLAMLKEMERFLKTVYVNGRDEVVADFKLAGRKICMPGQLTGTGYLQHIFLGEYMLNMYGRRLDINIASIEEEEIMVFATPIKRTQQSAAGFVTGMLEKVFKDIPGNNSEEYPTVKIRVSPDELGYFREDESNEIPSCSELERIIKEQRDSREFRNGIATFEHLLQKISQIFNISSVKLPALTRIFDMVATRYCHHYPPPCGRGGCIDNDVNLELLKAVDWMIKTKYTASATLATHPLLSKIAQRMLTHSRGEGHTKFVLYATHDSTVAPLLIEMGIFQNRWPPYASRIVFELWEAGGLLGSKLTGPEIDRHFIRVLYDGRDFTRKLKFCKDKLKFGKLCPLKAFVRALEGYSESMDVEYSRLCRKTTARY